MDKRVGTRSVVAPQVGVEVARRNFLKLTSAGVVTWRRAGSRVKAGYAVAIVAVSIASCAKGNESLTMPQNRVQKSMVSNDDLASVSPALERYRREALQANLWTRPQLSSRDRSIVTVAALIARNQAAEQAHYFAVALEHGVRPSEIPEIITHLAFYAGWPNAFSAVPVAKDVLDKRPR